MSLPGLMMQISPGRPESVFYMVKEVFPVRGTGFLRGCVATQYNVQFSPLRVI